MIEELLRRLKGLLLATGSIPLAAIAFLKGLPPPFNRTIHPPTSPFWHWIWRSMPGIRIGLQKQTGTDLLWCLPGMVALVLSLVGLGIAFGKKRPKVLRPWEEKL